MTKLCIFQIDISNKTWYNVQEISNMLEKTVNKDKNSCLRIPEFGIYVEDDQIILKKYMPACAFCSNASGITVFKGKNICSECLSELNKLN